MKGGMEEISTITDTDCEYQDCLPPDDLKAQVYLHYNFLKYDEASQKLPVNNWKKEVSYCYVEICN